uniref:Laminin subunit gamma-2 n=1 Tax=Lygus hesperus TaxID=30085 RepID=A0A0A9Z1C4_LYGHE
MYAIKRLSRYSLKLEDVKAQILQIENEIDDIENFGISSRMKDGEAIMETNPLNYQYNNLTNNSNIDEAGIARMKEELRQKKKLLEERKEVLRKLELAASNDKANLQQYQNKLRDIKVNERI